MQPGVSAPSNCCFRLHHVMLISVQQTDTSFFQAKQADCWLRQQWQTCRQTAAFFDFSPVTCVLLKLLSKTGIWGWMIGNGPGNLLFMSHWAESEGIDSKNLVLWEKKRRAGERRSNALWVKPCWKVEIEEISKMFPSGPIFTNLNHFRQNIWRLSSVQFHFWYLFRTSWTQPTAEEGITI